ncbi:Kazal-type serine protease inhibitor family protein [Nitrosopumilus sp.]|uniref:Kazal-type serine protease inhibitor family protein n=1 Tax=Nitrosopumilus sp. TaxID=2024843 RepID=UPI0026160A28|nr:Kazal-type serine protease inhibitor family protein [Nitrosopumilus sp.]
MYGILSFVFMLLSVGILFGFSVNAEVNEITKIQFGAESKNNISHIPYNNICAPGFVALENICVLNDRCGPGIYPGKICEVNGVPEPYLRPLQQKHAGISVDGIICAENRALLFREYSTAPYCVFPESVGKLRDRGWQEDIPVIACTLEFSPVCGLDGLTYNNQCKLKNAQMIQAYSGQCSNSKITNFEECVSAGNLVKKTFPRQCATDDGKNFVESIN